jgi:tetratricopeptide (TPR) repeat protein
MTVLGPEGWYVHQVDDEIFTGCVSKECIQTQGYFTTGLTLNAFRRVKEKLRQHNPNYHPDVPVMGILELMYPNFLSDSRLQVLYLDQGVQRTPGSRLFRFQYRQVGPVRPDLPWHGPLICQKLIIEFDESADVYHFTFESPESSWENSWQIGRQIMTNLVFSAGPSTQLLFSLDPPLPPDEVLQENALAAGRAMGWSLAYENRAEGLFIWRVLLPAPDREATRTIACCFSWYMKRVGNEIWVDDPFQCEPVAGIEVIEQLALAGRALQEEFKRRWLALVGPVMLRGPSPETHSAELMTKAALEVAAQGALAKLRAGLAVDDLVLVNANLLLDRGDCDGCIRLLDEAIALLHSPVPNQGPHEEMLARAYRSKGLALAELGDHVAAERCYGQATEFRNRQVTRQDQPNRANSWALGFVEDGNKAYQARHYRTALGLYRAAIALLEDLVHNRDAENLAPELARALIGEASALLELGEVRAAQSPCEQALAILEPLVTLRNRVGLQGDLSRARELRNRVLPGLDSP